MDYKDTVLLPYTAFSLKPKAGVEARLLAEWTDLGIYQRLLNLRAGAEPFILHDGPPYANGHIHIGHAVNKILKDAFVRTAFLAGKQAPYVPGWDCHGLPIEWKVEQNLRAEGQTKDSIDPLAFRHLCRTFAQTWVDTQREEFRRLGVLADWDHPYLTMDTAAEATIAEEISRFILDGSLYRADRPVMWSPVEQTALADAEVEYKDIDSTAAYVGLPFMSPYDNFRYAGTKLVIWTTTPWTLPLNEAVAFNPAIPYVLVHLERDAADPVHVIAARDRVDAVVKAFHVVSHTVVEEVPVEAFTPAFPPTVWHPWDDGRQVPVLPAEFVTADAGSGFVHIAPAHGIDDFRVGKQHGLPTHSRVLDDGVYDPSITGLGGVHVFKAATPILEAMGERHGLVLATEKIRHSYPHSWRSKAKVIYRTTPQWFIRLDGDTAIREKALAAIRTTTWLPDTGEARITSMVEGRPDWCISRQRAWGVPIPVFLHKATGEVLRDRAVQERVVERFRRDGADAWFESQPADYLSPEQNPDDYTMVRDIVDVWFESGSSHAFVLEQRPDLNSPADLYLEGSDQHRGWFQASLLESVATRGRAPFRTVLTHGFVLDGNRDKMSKSEGNVLSPQQVVDRFGTDVLRLWVLGSKYTEDLSISDTVLKHTQDIYQRFRLTLRYLLGNLQGWSEAEAGDPAVYPELDAWMWSRLAVLNQDLDRQFAEHDFTAAVATLHEFCTTDLSAFYFDIRKDRLYCDAATSVERRACRHTLRRVFQVLVRRLAPLVPFLAEEAYQELPEGDVPSVHLLAFGDLDMAGHYNYALMERMGRIRDIRAEVLPKLEAMRTQKVIGSSLQASVRLDLPERDWDLRTADWAEICIVSHVGCVRALDDSRGVQVHVMTAKGEKCPRCWQVHVEVTPDHPLCHRCTTVMPTLPAA